MVALGSFNIISCITIRRTPCKLVIMIIGLIKKLWYLIFKWIVEAITSSVEMKDLPKM